MTSEIDRRSHEIRVFRVGWKSIVDNLRRFRRRYFHQEGSPVPLRQPFEFKFIRPVQRFDIGHP